MSTITRLIETTGVGAGTNYKVQGRFHDAAKLHITKRQRLSALYYLLRAHQNASLSGILLNDLDMGCLTRGLTRSISRFAQRHSLALFIDPKRHRDKYMDVQATAVLPNLVEWCNLIGDPETEATNWRKKLKTPSGLQEIAERSLSSLRGYTYHVIKFDSDGLVFLGPDHSAGDEPAHAPTYNIYHITPPASGPPGDRRQLGCGDVFAAAFAYFYDEKAGLTGALCAVQRASAVVAAYRARPWHRMPTAEQIDATPIQPVPGSPDATTSAAFRYLPPSHEAVVSRARSSTALPGLFSVDQLFRDRIGSLLSTLKEPWWTSSKPKSVILGAPPGEGKSLVIAGLSRALSEIQIVEWAHDKLRASDEDEVRKSIEAERADERPLLIVIDEAAKVYGEGVRSGWVNLLNAVAKERARCLLVSAEFWPDPRQVDVLHPNPQEILGRCHLHLLTPLADRPADILVVAAAVLLKKSDGKPVRMRASAAAKLIGASLGLSSREVAGIASGAYDSAVSSGRGSSVEIEAVHVAGDDAPTREFLNYWITFDP